MLKITKGLISANGITQYTDDEGNKYVRVTMWDEDFCIAAHDLTRCVKNKFTWSDAMKVLKVDGLTMFTKRQTIIYVTHLDEINSKLREIGGRKLKDEYYWTSSECDAQRASVYHGNYVGLPLNYIDKYNKLHIRPIIDLLNK